MSQKNWNIRLLTKRDNGFIYLFCRIPKRESEILRRKKDRKKKQRQNISWKNAALDLISQIGRWHSICLWSSAKLFSSLINVRKGHGSVLPLTATKSKMLLCRWNWLESIKLDCRRRRRRRDFIVKHFLHRHLTFAKAKIIIY